MGIKNLIQYFILVFTISLFLVACETKTGKPTSMPSEDASATEEPSATPKGTPSSIPSPRPSPISLCCMLKDTCKDMNNISKCIFDPKYENHWINKSCSSIPGCRMGCCFYYDLEEGNGGTCDQRPATVCTLLGGSFYFNISCTEVEECDDRYGCCIWIEGSTLLSTVLEKDECLKKGGDPVFLEGKLCPERICLKNSDCFADGKNFCHPFEGSIYKETCNTAIRSCEQTLVEECEYGCRISTAKCIPAPSPSSSPKPRSTSA